MADLRRYYPGTTLGDLFTGRLTYLELDELLRNLPLESALNTARRDQFTDEELAAAPPPDKHGPWSRGDLLAAASLDSLQQLIYVQMKRGGVEVDPPAQLRRPGVVAAAPALPSPQAQAYLQRLRDRHEQQEGT